MVRPGGEIQHLGQFKNMADGYAYYADPKSGKCPKCEAIGTYEKGVCANCGVMMIFNAKLAGKREPIEMARKRLTKTKDIKSVKTAKDLLEPEEDDDLDDFVDDDSNLMDFESQLSKEREEEMSKMDDDIKIVQAPQGGIGILKKVKQLLMNNAAILARDFDKIVVNFYPFEFTAYQKPKGMQI